MRHAFISYSHEDHDFALLVQRHLNDNEIQTWLATENIKAGEEWREAIDDAIKRSFVIIVIVSPTSEQSKYVTYEWALGYGLNIPIIPVKYKQLAEYQKIHPRLETLQYEDFSSSASRPWERLVARLREIHTEILNKEKLDPKIADAVSSLDDWDYTKIIRASEYLGERKAQSAVRKLIQVLEEPRPDVKKAVIRALGDIGDTLAVEHIIPHVVIDTTRLEAIQALGKIADHRASQVLIEQFSQSNCRVKFITVSALERMTKPEVKCFLLDLLLDLSWSCHDVWEDNDDDTYWDMDKVIDNIFRVLSHQITEGDASAILIMLESEYEKVIVGGIKLLEQLKAKDSLVPILRLISDEGLQTTVLSALNTILPGFRDNLQKLEKVAKSDYNEPIDFFYINFGIEGLIYTLGYPKSNAYWEIAKKIETVVTKEDIPRLIDSLKSPSPRVKGLTVEVIRCLELTECYAALKSLIDDDSPFVRGLVIKAIGDLKISGVSRQLKSRLNDTEKIFSNSDDEVSDYAALALGKLGNKVAIPRLESLSIKPVESNIVNEATSLLLTMGELSENTLLESALVSTNLGVSIRALKILASINYNIDIKRLFRELNQDDATERENALKTLKVVYPPFALIIALRSNGGKAYWQIAERLQEVIEPRHLSFVKQCFSDGNYLVRAFLAEVAGLRPDLALGECLIPLVDDTSAFTRSLAIRALGRLKYKDAIENIKKHLEDTETIYTDSQIRVCDYSAIALAKLGQQVSEQLVDALNVSFTEVQNELLEIYAVSSLDLAEVSNEIKRRIDIQDQETLVQAIRLLAKIGDKERNTEIAHCLIHEDSGIRWAASWALNKLADIQLVPTLFNLLKQSAVSNKNLSYLIQLIGDLGQPEHAHDLLDFFVDSTYANWIPIRNAILKIADESIMTKAVELLGVADDDYVRIVCLDILKVHGNDSLIDKIFKLLETHHDPSVTFRALDVLSIYGDASLIPYISQFAESEESVRCAVVNAYGKLIDNSSLKRILPFLDDPSYGVRCAAVWALVNIGDEVGFYHIIERLDVWGDDTEEYAQKEYNIYSIIAVGKLGTTDNIPQLEKIALEHPKVDYRAASAVALGHFQDDRSIDVLKKLLTDRDLAFYQERVCDVAAKCLYQMQDLKTQQIVDEWLSGLHEDEIPNVSEPVTFDYLSI